MIILSFTTIISMLCAIIGLYVLIITSGFGFWLKYTLVSLLTFLISAFLINVIYEKG